MYPKLAWCLAEPCFDWVIPFIILMFCLNVSLSVPLLPFLVLAAFVYVCVCALAPLSLSLSLSLFSVTHQRDFGLVWFDLIWFDLIWFDLIWFDLIWFDLIWLGLVRFGLMMICLLVVVLSLALALILPFSHCFDDGAHSEMFFDCHNPHFNSIQIHLQVYHQRCKLTWQLYAFMDTLIFSLNPSNVSFLIQKIPKSFSRETRDCDKYSQHPTNNQQSKDQTTIFTFNLLHSPKYIIVRELDLIDQWIGLNWIGIGLDWDWIGIELDWDWIGIGIGIGLYQWSVIAAVKTTCQQQQQQSKNRHKRQQYCVHGQINIQSKSNFMIEWMHKKSPQHCPRCSVLLIQVQSFPISLRDIETKHSQIYEISQASHRSPVEVMLE